MRVSATLSFWLGKRDSWVVLPSHMRASATFFVTATTTCTSCPTLSGEGVCNTASALNGRSFLLSYPLKWGCLQQNIWCQILELKKLSYPLRWGRLQPTQNQHIGELDVLLGLFQSLEIQSAYDIELETSQIYGKNFKCYDNISRFSALQ